MSLVVYTDQDLAQTEKQVVELFSRVKNNELGSISYKSTPVAFRAEDLMKLRKIKTLQSMRKLIVTFVLPPLRHEFRASPLTVIKFLLEHKGSGSLVSWLIKQKLAVDIQVNSFHFSDLLTLLEVSLDLTEKGFASHETIVKRLFEYLSLVRAEGVSPQLVKEIQTILNLKFNFKSKVSAIDKVKEVAQKLNVYPPHLVNKIDFLMDSFDAQKFQNLLQLMSPKNILIILKNDKFKRLSQKDPHYGTEFQDQPLTAEFKKSLDAILEGAQ